MLTPKQLEKAADALIPIWDELKEWITLDLIARITARLTEEDISLSSSELWRLEVFEELGGLTDDLQERIKHTVRLSDDELRRVFIEHGVRSAADDSTVYEDIERARERARKSPRDASEEESAAHSDKLYSTEESPAERRTQRESGGEEDSESQGSPLDNMSERMKDIMNDAYTRTNGELYNFTRTTADSVQTQFIRELDQAYLKVASGACSQWQAAQEAVDNIIKHQGTVTYPSGHTDTIETAVIRAVRTGIARMSGALAIEGAKEHGLNHVLVSSHLGARVGDGTPGHENHAWWQGKVYTIEGGSEEYPNLEEATGYPSDPRGLCGYNCRHNMRPFAPDVMYNSTKQYDPEENEEAYEISQQLRRMERRLRVMRTAVRAATNAFYSCTDEDLRESLEDRMNKFAGKYDRLKDEYLDFCDTHGIRPSYERLFEARDRVGKSANSGGEISTPESVANSGESGIIETEEQKRLKEMVGNGSVSLEINSSVQDRHYRGTSAYKSFLDQGEEKSYFLISQLELQQILNQKYATGSVRIDNAGVPREIIDCGKIVAYDTELQRKTSFVKIHYSKKRTHLSPYTPNNTE